MNVDVVEMSLERLRFKKERSLLIACSVIGCVFVACFVLCPSVLSGWWVEPLDERHVYSVLSDVSESPIQRLA